MIKIILVYLHMNLYLFIRLFFMMGLFLKVIIEVEFLYIYLVGGKNNLVISKATIMTQNIGGNEIKVQYKRKQ
jgi:hypothetical protein